MSLHEYEASKEISKSDPPFYALIMAAMRKADDKNLGRLRSLWPETWDELTARYEAPGGFLAHEEIPIPKDSGCFGCCRAKNRHSASLAVPLSYENCAGCTSMTHFSEPIGDFPDREYFMGHSDGLSCAGCEDRFKKVCRLPQKQV